MRKLAGMVLLALVAGPAWAGDAWVADYVVDNAGAEKSLVVIRSNDRVEYRMGNEAPRIWRKTADGVEMQELHPIERKIITYSPGDLRTLGMEMDWDNLTGLVPSATRGGLVPSGESRQFGMRVVHYTGQDVRGNAVRLDWLPEAALPFLYSAGKAEEDHKTFRPSLRLRGISHIASEQAFSATDGLLEIDEADLGDMEMNPEMQRLTHHAD